MKRIFDFAKFLIFIAVLAGITSWLGNYSAIEVAGNARVIDGDSLVVDGQEVRLFGIDAPEYRQICNLEKGKAGSYPCGANSARYLRKMVGSGLVTCTGNGKDKYERLLAVCTIGETELNREMVLQGWAVSFGDYVSEEQDAESRATGLWQGDFELPSEWRRSEREKHSQGGLLGLFTW
ncbi:MAG: thermonuclease family protein [Pseudomonadota bacterium]